MPLLSESYWEPPALPPLPSERCVSRPSCFISSPDLVGTVWVEETRGEDGKGVWRLMTHLLHLTKGQIPFHMNYFSDHVLFTMTNVSREILK